jgi:16S rRNA (uracil1498-N3)-methyltransferase
MAHRFFIPPYWLTPPTVQLRDNVARQIKTVLRLQPGDEIVVLDNSGQEWQVSLTKVGPHEVQGQIVVQRPALGEAQTQLTLYQGMLKGQKFEWVLQKGTELGVSRFTPTLCRRSVVQRVEAGKYPRWQHIIQEAAEQSRRGRLPELAQAMPLEAAIQHAQGNSLLLMPWEEATGQNLKTVLKKVDAQSIALFIGPEGGFTTAEASMFQAAGGHLVKLGPRILRAETAALAACAAILYELGDWD